MRWSRCLVNSDHLALLTACEQQKTVFEIVGKYQSQKANFGCQKIASSENPDSSRIPKNQKIYVPLFQPDIFVRMSDSHVMRIIHRCSIFKSYSYTFCPREDKESL